MPELVYDQFGNLLTEEERFRQMMEQQQMGLLPGLLGGPAVDTFSAMPTSLPAYGPAAGYGPSNWMGPMQSMPTYNQQPSLLVGPTVNKFKPLGSDYTPKQLGTPVKDLQQQNIPSNVVPITPTLAGLSFDSGKQPAKPSSLYPDAIIRDAMLGMYDDLPDYSVVTDDPTRPVIDPFVGTTQGTLDVMPTARPSAKTELQLLDDMMPNVEIDQVQDTGIIPASDLRIGRGLRDFYAPTDDVATDVTPQVPMYSDDTWDAANPFNRGFIDRMVVDSDAARNIDTFADMPQETQASPLDWLSTAAEATARNVVGKLGIDLGPMSTGMSEEGLEKVLETAWENQKSNPNNPVALTTLQAGQLGLSKQDESAYDANIGAIPAGVVSLSPAGYTYNDPAGIQLVSAAAAADPTQTPAEMISKKTGIPFTEKQIDFLGKAIGVHPVTDFAPSTGGGGTDALYYQGYTAPDTALPDFASIDARTKAKIDADVAAGMLDVNEFSQANVLQDAVTNINNLVNEQQFVSANPISVLAKTGMLPAVANFDMRPAVQEVFDTIMPTTQAAPVAAPAGPSAADIERQKQAAINARMAQQATARQQQQAQAAQVAQAAAQAQAASAAQAQAAQNAARAVLASAEGRDRGGPSQAEINAAIEVMGQVDTFGSGGQVDRMGPSGGYGGEVGGRDTGGGYHGR